MYWTDDALGRLSVARLDAPRAARVLLQEPGRAPRSLALDPAAGYGRGLRRVLTPEWRRIAHVDRSAHTYYTDTRRLTSRTGSKLRDYSIRARRMRMRDAPSLGTHTNVCRSKRIVASVGTTTADV